MLKLISQEDIILWGSNERSKAKYYLTYSLADGTVFNVYMQYCEVPVPPQTPAVQEEELNPDPSQPPSSAPATPSVPAEPQMEGFHVLRITCSTPDGTWIDLLPNGNISQKRMSIPDDYASLVGIEDTSKLNTAQWVRLHQPSVSTASFWNRIVT